MAEAKRFEYIIEFEPYYMENDRKELCFKSKSVQKLIRCTDCRFFDSYPVDHTDGKCTRFHGLVTYEDFCSDAEEKEETE